MRTGIYKDNNEGERRVNIQKALGACYNNGWFTNTRNIRYRLFKGARNSKKSYNMIGNETVIRMISDNITNVLIVRKNDVDNRETTFSNVVRAINDFGLENDFKINKTNMDITYRDGRKIIFAGLNNPTSINSLQPSVGILSAVYIEEAFEIDSEEAFNKLDQSLRTNGREYNEEGELVEVDYPQQITLCFNAWAKEHWIYHKFFEGRLEDDEAYLETHKYMDYRDDNFVGGFGTGLYLHISTYKANEFRKSSVDLAAAEMKKNTPAYYRTIFLGCWGVATATVYPEFSMEKNVWKSEVIEAGDGNVSGFKFTKFYIGIDTGLSAGDGSKIKVRKNEDPTLRVKAANTMCLVGVVGAFEKLVVIDEYFHSNDPTYSVFNSDGNKNLNILEQSEVFLSKMYEWADKFRDTRKDMLMKGPVYVFIDSADKGMLQVLSMQAGELGSLSKSGKKLDLKFVPSSKSPIAGRVDFERVMFGYGDLIISDKCKNLIREILNARRGDKGEARLDGNDHQITAFEYAYLSVRNQFVRWKSNFKEETKL